MTKKTQTDKVRLDWLSKLTITDKNRLQKAANSKNEKFWKCPETAFRQIIDEVMSNEK